MPSDWRYKCRSDELYRSLEIFCCRVRWGGDARINPRGPLELAGLGVVAQNLSADEVVACASGGAVQALKQRIQA